MYCAQGIYLQDTISEMGEYSGAKYKNELKYSNYTCTVIESPPTVIYFHDPNVFKQKHILV